MKKIFQTNLLYPEILWERPVHYYKSQAGRIFVLAGSKKASSNAIMTCESIFRSGTGILTLGFPDRLSPFYKEVLPEAMRLPLPSTLSDSIAKRGEKEILEQAKVCDVALLGPGLSSNAETAQLVWELIFKLEKPIILDSDGLFALIKGIEVMRDHETEEFMDNYFKKLKEPLILVATVAEIAKIVIAAHFDDNKKTSNEIKNQVDKYASLIAEKFNVYVVVKGLNTIVAEPNGTVLANQIREKLNYPENSDVLSGIIASFIGQNPEKLLKAIATATFLHDLAAQKAAAKVKDRPLAGSDILRYLPEAIKTSE